MKKIIFTIFLLFLTYFGWSLSASFDLFKYNNTQSSPFIEIFMAVDAFSTVFEKNENDKFQSSIFCQIVIEKDNNIVFADKFNFLSPEMESEKFQMFYFQTLKRISLMNGNYVLYLEMKDNFSKDSAVSITYPFEMMFANETVQLGSIRLLDDFYPSEITSSSSRNGFELVNKPTSFFVENEDVLKYFSEIYNVNKLVGDDEPILVFTVVADKETGMVYKDFGTFKKMKAASTLPLLGQIDISKLGSGNYLFTIEIRDKSNKRLAVEYKDFQRFKNIEIPKFTESADDADIKNTFVSLIPSDKIFFYLKSLIPIAEETEVSSIQTLLKSEDTTVARRYLLHFWKKRHEAEAVFYWQDYRKRADYAHTEFGCTKYSGLNSERGRVFLKYGQPNRIEDQFSDPIRNVQDMPLDYEIWYYYKLGSQTNRLFVFQQQNRGDCNYQLVHSNVKGELGNPDWMNSMKFKEILQKDNNANPIENIRDENLQFE